MLDEALITNLIPMPRKVLRPPNSGTRRVLISPNLWAFNGRMPHVER